MKRLATLFACAMPMMAEQLDRVCHSGFCRSLEVENGEVQTVDSSGFRTSLGPYLAEHKNLAPEREAPFRTFRSQHGHRVILTWGFGSEFRAAGSGAIFRVYIFADGSTKAIVRYEGDIFLRTLKFEQLNTEEELLVVSMQNEVPIGVRSEIWAFSAKGVKKVFSRSVTVSQAFRCGDQRLAIEVERCIRGLGASTDRWVKEVWVWNSETTSFIQAPCGSPAGQRGDGGPRVGQ